MRLLQSIAVVVILLLFTYFLCKKGRILMINNKSLLKKRQSGVTMIEYALIAALISVAAITMLTPIGDAILAKLTVVKVAIVGS